MKNLRIVIATLIFSLLFTGTAFAATKAEISNNAARYLIEKTNEAMAGVTSFKAEGVVDLLVNVYTDGEKETVDAEFVFEGLFDLPEKAYVKYDIDMGDGYPVVAEVLISEAGISMRMPGIYDGWETVDDAETMALVAMALSGDTEASEEMLKELGLDIAAFEDKLYSNARYTRNVQFLGETYYAVDMSFELKEVMAEMMGYMEGIYIAQEEYMYEGYAEEAMFMMNMLSEKIEGTLEMTMLIEKDTYYTAYTGVYMELAMDMEELLGAEMDMIMDIFLAYSDFGSTNLPFPTMN